MTQLTPHRGVMILVFGILGLIVCPIFAIMSWIMGNKDLALIDAGRMDPAGRDLTKIGRILGMVGTGLLVLGIVFMILYFVVLIGIFGVAASQ